MRFDDTLDRIKAQFVGFRALLVLDDKVLRRYVMAWGPLLVRRVDDWPLDDTLAGLWACVDVDFDALGDLTNDSHADVVARFRQMQALELVYPDGTVAQAVVKVLTNELNKYAKA